MQPLAHRYANRIKGTLACFDRLIIWGTLPAVSHVGGMMAHLTAAGTRLAQFTDRARELRDRLMKHLERTAEAEGVPIEYLASASIRKEARVQEIIRVRGDHPGLVHIFSVVEPAQVFEAKLGVRSGNPHLVRRRRPCKHYYLYFIDEHFGLCHLRICTFLPFWVQFYCNGHSWLARELQRRGIAFTQVDNAFTDCADWEQAQKLANAFSTDLLHRTLDAYALKFFPVFQELGTNSYHWSITQAEYATDIVFRDPGELRHLYDHLVRQAILTVKSSDVATFLGRTLPTDPAGQEIGSNVHLVVEGMRIRHQWDRHTAIKMYDKHGVMLRIETTTAEVESFKHHREVVHKNGTSSIKRAAMRKTIHSLPTLSLCMGACNRRYLTFLEVLDDPTPGVEAVENLGDPTRNHGRTYRGFNLFSRCDHDLFLALSNPKWTLRGFSNANLCALLKQLTTGQVSRLLKRLRMAGLIDRITKTYKYRLTPTGQRVVLGALSLRRQTAVSAAAA